MRMKHGSSTAADYAIEFCTLVAGSGWSEPALLTVSLGFKSQVQRELGCRGESLGFEDCIKLSISIYLLQDRA